MGKLLFDLFPVVLFFIAYKKFDIYVATAAIMVATLVQVISVYLYKRKVEKMYLVTLGAILLFGGATLALRDPVFIKWKPTIMNWLFSVVFLGSQFIGQKPVIQRMMESSLPLPAPLWPRLNISWVLFFLVSGIANLAVAFTCSENTWVNFKLFGLTAMSLVFMAGQVFLLRHHLAPAEVSASSES